MSLSSSLFSGISGLSTLGNAMQIIGDNIANVNTVGFKSSSFSFQDLLSQSVSTLSGTSQVGRGTALGDISASFDQGSFESTSNPTDLAIGGDGFFVLKEAGTTNLFYSRAGNFRFNEIGNFINPQGYIVQGWTLDSNGTDVGTIDNIQLSSFTSAPSETSNVEVIVNLNSNGSDNSSGADTSLYGAWNGTSSTPIGTSAYEYQTSLLVYDSLGSTHDLTFYFDKAATASTYEYIVTCNPSEDKRTFAATKEITDITCVADVAASLDGKYFTLYDDGGSVAFWIDVDNSGTTIPAGASAAARAVEITTIATGMTAAQVAAQVQAAIDADAKFSATAADAVVTVTDASTGARTNASAGTSGFTATATAQGGTATSHPLQGLLARGTLTFGTDGSITGTTLDQINTATGGVTVQTTSDVSNGYYTFAPSFISGSSATIELNFGLRYNGSSWVKKSLSTSQYASGSTTTFQTADGYGAGDLEGVHVDVDGVITGSYSNGQLLPLFRVGLAKFQNTQGLFKEGGNLYSETRKSGSAITNKPGTNGLGSIAPNALEQSNVDIAQELVKMITTQRGFQANSKIITVADQMLQDLINIKR
ncbi:MAG: flagellar hook protein FlgE [Pseudomonadota bacterium]